MAATSSHETPSVPAWRYVAVAVLLTVLGVVVSVALSIPAFAFPTDSLAFIASAVVLGEAGYAVVAVAFLLLTRRGLAYLDLSLPTSSWGLVAAVTVGLSVFRLAALVASSAAGIEAAPSSVVEFDVPLSVLLPVLIVASVLVIGPAEELLFRGVVQKYLRERFSARAAVLGAGALFAAIHVLALVTTSTVGVAFSLLMVFVIGVVLGWLYERTGSLPAAMLAHGLYDALAFGLAYVLLLLGYL